MTEEDYKAVIASYQQKAFELFNTNIVLDTQVNTLRKTIEELTTEIEKLKKTRKTKQDSDDF
jgi:uncharacterized small protein (DUF1192 family)